ncbi:MAG: Rieske 2Fe-2S domain-containing protein [Candidatus Wallbacteria bacterium]|nr:Rieske 2Fe-2S domain-containing protein [Candidatus Wallbacteria bacterium]
MTRCVRGTCGKPCSRSGGIVLPSGDAPAAPVPDSRTRREFLSKCAGWTLAATVAGYASAAVAYLDPRVLYEPPTQFSIGRPIDFAPGSATFLEEKRLFVFRASEGLYAVSAVCSHLGCNVRWTAAKEDFECPCHGSVYDRQGRVVSGPAPRPLEWYALSCNKSGVVMVDTTKTVAPDFRLRV